MAAQRTAIQRERFRFFLRILGISGAVGAVYRTIPVEIKSFNQLALPAVVAQIAENLKQDAPYR